MLDMILKFFLIALNSKTDWTLQNLPTEIVNKNTLRACQSTTRSMRERVHSVADCADATSLTGDSTLGQAALLGVALTPGTALRLRLAAPALLGRCIYRSRPYHAHHTMQFTFFWCRYSLCIIIMISIISCFWPLEMHLAKTRTRSA